MCRGAQGSGEGTEERLDFPVDHDGVNSFFAAEVLINHRLGNFGASRDFFDTGPIEAFFREEGARNGEELFAPFLRSEEHTSELQSRGHLVCRLLLEKKTSAVLRTPKLV